MEMQTKQGLELINIFKAVFCFVEHIIFEKIKKTSKEEKTMLLKLCLLNFVLYLFYSFMVFGKIIIMKEGAHLVVIL